MTIRASPSRYTNLDLGVSSSPANSFITDISVLFLRGHGNWLAASTWVTLLGDLDIPSATARTALHRMTKAGFLQRQAHAGRPGYSMSDAWILLESQDPTDLTLPPTGTSSDTTPERLALLTLTVPETRRRDRHMIRSHLGRNGFAPLGNGVWIGASVRLNAVRDALEGAALSEHVELFEADYVGFADVHSLVARCWDIDTIAARYQDLIDALRRRLERKASEDSGSFASVVASNNMWRRANFVDPHLPASVLPRNWPRDTARDLMMKLLDRFLTPARAYVDALNAE
jgi:phenylacetic acid degradation operon negative regulatory protein